MLLDNTMLIRIRNTVNIYTEIGSGMLADMNGGKAVSCSAMVIMRSFLMIGCRCFLRWLWLLWVTCTNSIYHERLIWCCTIQCNDPSSSQAPCYCIMRGLLQPVHCGNNQRSQLYRIIDATRGFGKRVHMWETNWKMLIIHGHHDRLTHPSWIHPQVAHRV